MRKVDGFPRSAGWSEQRPRFREQRIEKGLPRRGGKPQALDPVAPPCISRPWTWDASDTPVGLLLCPPSAKRAAVSLQSIWLVDTHFGVTFANSYWLCPLILEPPWALHLWLEHGPPCSDFCMAARSPSDHCAPCLASAGHTALCLPPPHQAQLWKGGCRRSLGLGRRHASNTPGGVDHGHLQARPQGADQT